jgi:hypothetical protein
MRRQPGATKLQCPREELLQKTFRDITHPNALAAGVESFAALMREELASYGLEKRYVRKDGSPVSNTNTLVLTTLTQEGCSRRIIPRTIAALVT